MKTNILFIGALNYPGIATAGDSIKNRLLLDWLKQYFKRVCYVDTQTWRKNPFILCKLLFFLLFYKIDNILVSTSNQSAYRIICFIDALKLKDTKVFYFMIGGYTPIKIKQGFFRVEPFTRLERIIVEADKVKDLYAEVGLYNTFRVYNFKSTLYRADVTCPHEGKIKFVFLSRLTELKGIFHILESVKALNSEGIGYRFEVDFFGAFENKEVEYKFTNEISSINNASYKGFLDLSKDSNYEVLASYDALLFPTMHPTEGFPGVIADAAFAGLPVIAANWNYAKELVQDCGCGFVFPVGDNLALTDIMRDTINHRERLQEIRKNCVMRAELYRTDKILTPDLIDMIGMKR